MKMFTFIKNINYRKGTRQFTFTAGQTLPLDDADASALKSYIKSADAKKEAPVVKVMPAPKPEPAPVVEEPVVVPPVVEPEAAPEPADEETPEAGPDEFPVDEDMALPDAVADAVEPVVEEPVVAADAVSKSKATEKQRGRPKKSKR